MTTINVITTQEELDKVFADNKGKVVVVDVFANWCGPCRAIAPKLPGIAQSLEVCIVKIDCDESQDLAEKYDVSALPTFLIFKDGKKVETIVGADVKKLEEEIGKAKCS